MPLEPDQMKRLKEKIEKLGPTEAFSRLANGLWRDWRFKKKTWKKNTPEFIKKIGDLK